MEIMKSTVGLEVHGLTNLSAEHWNLMPPALYEHIVRRGEGMLTKEGPIAVKTGKHTGRSPHDRYIVREATTQDTIWWGKTNVPISEAQFDGLHRRMAEYLERREVFIQDTFVGHDPAHQLPIRVITEYAWQSLFAYNMFVRPNPEQLNAHQPEYTVIAAPNFTANPERDGTHSETFIIINMAKKMVLIGGTHYAGEIKKAMFTIMNYLMPLKNAMTMHCSANYGADADDAAVFFGLSGTGKTTLSADNGRVLVGDDEHGWTDEGVFNYEGGCYAKMIRLSETGEPQIYGTTRRFGTILENVVVDLRTREIDLDDSRYTENTRGSYPLEYIGNIAPNGQAGHPKHIFFLTADAFGVLPPISKLTPDQAQYHFLAGYTAKVAGTEKGLGKEPQATFSTCFGAPFMVHHPTRYADLLSEKIQQHGSQVWLINTGWTGGPYGVGHRIELAYTRLMVRAALARQLDDVPTAADPVFGVHVPQAVPGVPSELLTPRDTWTDGAAYDRQAAKLAGMFHENFAQYADQASAAVRAAAPRIALASV